MARKHDQERMGKIYKTIEKQPGKRPELIARLLGESRSKITRTLPAM